jgi:hypothetical protein
MMIGIGLGQEDWGEGGYGVPGTPMVVGGGGGGANYMPLLQDITRITGSIASNVLSPPIYRTATTPSGSLTEIRSPSGLINYPGGGAGPTSVPVAGVSVTTMLLLGVAAMALLVMAKR